MACLIAEDGHKRTYDPQKLKPVKRCSRSVESSRPRQQFCSKHDLCEVDLLPVHFCELMTGAIMRIVKVKVTSYGRGG